MKNLTKYCLASLLCFALLSSACLAAPAADEQGGSLLLMLFIGFFALIVVFQLVPACLLFIGMVRGLFVRGEKAVEKKSQV